MPRKYAPYRRGKYQVNTRRVPYKGYAIWVSKQTGRYAPTVLDYYAERAGKIWKLYQDGSLVTETRTLDKSIEYIFGTLPIEGCPTCNGARIYNDELCRVCDGTGFISLD